ncbi:MAG: DUF4258 domain-containing protein [Sphingomonadaceae bacterium]|jgi:hypothetical protein
MIDPVPMRMNDASALKLLREIAEDSGRVIFTRHALQRMRQRKVSTAQVLTCLRRGILSSQSRWIRTETGS